MSIFDIVNSCYFCPEVARFESQKTLNEKNDLKTRGSGAKGPDLLARRESGEENVGF